MNVFPHVFTLLLTSAFVVGCGTQRPPDCSDSATLEAVTHAYIEHLERVAEKRPLLGWEDILRHISENDVVLHDIEPISYDEKIKRLECKGTLNIQFSEPFEHFLQEVSGESVTLYVKLVGKALDTRTIMHGLKLPDNKNDLEQVTKKLRENDAVEEHYQKIRKFPYMDDEKAKKILFLSVELNDVLLHKSEEWAGNFLRDNRELFEANGTYSSVVSYSSFFRKSGQLEPAISVSFDKDGSEIFAAYAQFTSIQSLEKKSKEEMVAPVLLHYPPPEYPQVAREKGEEGTVVLWIAVAADGTPVNWRVEQSSGHEQLDNAALAGAAGMRFEPARRGNRAVAATVMVPMEFQLQ